MINKQVILFLKGLPGSGKTTFAKKWVLEAEKRVRVNKDDIRKMIGYTRDKEALVLSISREVILTSLSNGYSIAIDDTNFNPDHLNWIKKQLEFMNLGGFDIDFTIVNMDTSLDECIKRDNQREDKVGEKVIRDMHTKYFTQD